MNALPRYKELQERMHKCVEENDRETFNKLLDELAVEELNELNSVSPEERLLASIFEDDDERPRTKKLRRPWLRKQRKIKKMYGYPNRTFVLSGYHTLRDIHPRCIVMTPGSSLRLRGNSYIDAILVDHNCRLELDTRFVTQRPHVHGVMAAKDAKVVFFKDQIDDYFDLDKIRQEPGNYAAMKRVVFCKQHKTCGN